MKHHYSLISYIFRLYEPKEVFIVGIGICPCRGSMILEGEHEQSLHKLSLKTSNHIGGPEKWEWVNIALTKLILRDPQTTLGKPDLTNENPYLLFSRLRDGYNLNIPVPGELKEKASYNSNFFNPVDEDIAIYKVI